MGRRGARGGKNSAGSGSGGGDASQQRVVIKASYTFHRQVAKARAMRRAHVSYPARDSASADGEPGRFYDAHSADAGIAGAEAGQRFRQEQWEKDRHHFRLIISPERGDLIQQQGAMVRFVRDLRYLNRRCDRLHRPEFPMDDNLYVAADRARLFMQDLHMAAY